MPPTPIPVGYGIVTAQWTRIDDAAENVITFGIYNPSSFDPNSIAVSVRSFFLADFTAGMTCDSYQFDGIKVLLHTVGGYASGEDISPVVGTNAAEPVPPSVAVRVTKRSAFVGRAHRGRMYVPPALVAASGVEEAGTLTAGQQTSLQSAFGTLRNDLVSYGTPMVILHRDLSTPDAVTHLDVRNTVGSQRRRQRLG